MGQLSVTLIDVGWGDCVLIDGFDDSGRRRFGLIDCNDYERQRTALAFVKRYFERLGIDWKAQQHNFEWVLLTHGHADHARGLKEMIRTFGTRHFWYPKSVASTTYGVLLDFANRSDRVLNHQAIDETKILGAPEVDFPAELRVLWPNFNEIDTSNENNNSVVLALTLGGTSLVLTGDAEAENWPVIIERLPPSPTYVQVPHHGGRNGIFDPADQTPLLDRISPRRTRLVMSSHVVPHGHPHPDVVAELAGRGFVSYRTDLNYHVTLTSDGSRVRVGYTHVSGRLP
ncbi:MAG: MBL fold metallo-hydrolase [Actinobacteria bacterium]|nr:MBL fold metallo-hydrolase [Actinomycetota bacterium]MCI0543488.1 MBL fold metallo-hydrolase [Actinomycetota bacterium]MCI0677775.1 MBL fold metallo-hydrolase [Actinomycetota bacterium]